MPSLSIKSVTSGNFDEINQPRNISDYSKKTVCFYMFIDEVTEAYLRSSGKLGSNRKVGIWRTVVVRNPPYTDGRRTGKVRFIILCLQDLLTLEQSLASELSSFLNNL